MVPDSRPLHRENVPGPVEHTGDVDQFEAELVAGADGQAAEDPDAAERAEQELELGQDGRDADGHDVLSAPDVEERPGMALTPAGATGTDEANAGAVAATGRTATTPTENAQGRGGGRFINFLRASWAELQRVQWPDRRQVGQATAVVLGFVVIAGLFLGAADFVADKVVDLII